MSAISNAHSVVDFDSKTSKPFEGQRLSKVLYKTPKDGSVKQQNRCVSIPMLATVSAEELVQLSPYVLGMMRDAQDSIIKRRVEDKQSIITDADISFECILAELQDQATGNRLTKEAIIEWFVAENGLGETLMVAIADKLKIPATPSEAETKRLNQMVAVYRDSFAQLAGGKTAFTPDKATKMRKALELVVDTDDMAKRFDLRLKKMIEAEEVELTDL